MSFVLGLVLPFIHVLGGAVTSAPTYVSALCANQPVTVQAAETLEVSPQAEVQPQAEAQAEPPPEGSWTVSGEISVGESALPYKVEGLFVSGTSEPVVTKVAIGPEGLGVVVDVPRALEAVMSNYSEDIGQALLAIGKFKLQGVVLKFCVNVVCVTAEVNAEGPIFN